MGLIYDFPLAEKQYDGVVLREMPDGGIIVTLARDDSVNHVVFAKSEEEETNINCINICIKTLNQTCEGKPTPPLPILKKTYFV